MCGIFGLTTIESSNYSRCFIENTINQLFLLSESRGKDASGVVFYSEQQLSHYESPVPASRFVKTKNYNELLGSLLKNSMASKKDIIDRRLSIMGHTRLATNGDAGNINNNQPVIMEKIVGIHNGIVVNSYNMHDLFSLPSKKGVSDSETIFLLLDLFIKQGLSIQESMRKIYQNIEGSASIVVLIPHKKTLLLGTNTGSLYLCKNKAKNICIFASELPILKKLIKKIKLQDLIGECFVEHIVAGSGIELSLNDLSEKRFSLEIDFSEAKEKEWPSDKYFSSLLNGISSFNNHNEFQIKRCSRCVLPETIPFIKFNHEGVCNYCISHKKIIYKGKDSLEELVSRYRRSDGRPDCLVALSGGRDSAYCLHYVKRVLKMNPIAFTYDWGMVPDIARMNQARLVGKLGVEHVVISAFIQKQRKFIRQNVKAWLKKPHLGMVVLFMAADKPAEYYARKVAKDNDIELVFFARGNEFENTDFKWGFLGMPHGEPGGVLHNLSLSGRIKFSLNAAWQFIRNPAYINSSIWETLFDYWTTYILTYNFVYLWHYVSWDEAKIVSMLKNEYSWEVSQDTIQTWRTDDGTSPFYNYIYYTLAGFTENDAFRSNQIREGVLSRKDALSLTMAENAPRHEAIKDYLDKLGLDYCKTIKSIQSIPKLYV